jgi:hypothetical protein
MGDILALPSPSQSTILQAFADLKATLLDPKLVFCCLLFIYIIHVPHCRSQDYGPFRLKFQQISSKIIFREFGSDGSKLVGMKQKQFIKVCVWVLLYFYPDLLDI